MFPMERTNVAILDMPVSAKNLPAPMSWPLGFLVACFNGYPNLSYESFFTSA